MKLTLLTIFFGFGAVLAANPSQDLNIQIIRKQLELNVLKQQQGSAVPNWNDPATTMDALQLIEAQGYPAGEYDVTTEDGFILALHRVEAPRNRKPPKDGMKRGPPVLVVHGLESSSVCWTTDLWNESLAFVLADQGYDVWLGNVRGNTYTRRHVTLSPESRDFWQWSLDEMAQYDIPAMVDFIIQTTGYQKVFYVGHSQGTMVGFYGFSSNPTLASKIRAFFALAPVARLGSITSGIAKIAPYTTVLDTFFKIFGYNDFLPDNGIIALTKDKICEDSSYNRIDREICEKFYYKLTGPPSTSLSNVSRVAVKLAHTPEGTSSQNVAHFGQLVNSNKCRKFDFGFLQNKAKYGQYVPPEYDLTKLNVPTAIFHGGQDKLADPTDVAWLKTQIPSTLIGDFYYEDYTHTDFVGALNAAKIVYNEILNLMKKY